MQGFSIVVLALLAGPAAAGLLRKRLPSPARNGVPPIPVVELPLRAKDKAYNSKDEACSACKFHASSSCAMFKTCVCFAANTMFGTTSGGFDMESSDVDNWHWSCNADVAGSKYELCFNIEGQTHMTLFGDKEDPNEPICP
eukprot:gnl/MRDRNA2_/MRDRNA2_82518_c0_seq4.p1 gnl/MRDRNA2_/MRDRNA2_82518_c0~~gnl/MRDRNA2_/MRDRNA2_82518_c0_seq4.p1  ORF type:complete len:141 (-),score=28.88 gnl/MRDRNA2_/MRDRNA2_82518_c0_seq4:771-1193(-)